MVRVLHLEPVFTSAFWNSIVLGNQTGRGETMLVRRGVGFLDDFAPKFGALLVRTSEQQELVLDQNEDRKASETNRLTFLVREPSAPSLTIKAFAEILTSLDTLYSVVLKINGLDATELVVGALDAGSDKSFDVIGVAGAITKLSDLLLQAWDKVRFARALKTTSNFKAALEGLTFLEHLKHTAENGGVSAEEAEKLRRTAVNCISNLFSAGVYTFQMETQPVVKPSQLPVERRKQITHYVEQPLKKGKGRATREEPDRSGDDFED